MPIPLCTICNCEPAIIKATISRVDNCELLADAYFCREHYPRNEFGDNGLQSGNLDRIPEPKED